MRKEIFVLTGTLLCLEEETNDYAIVRPPGRAPLLVAAYYDAPGVDMASREAVLREVGHEFVKWARAGA